MFWNSHFTAARAGNLTFRALFLKLLSPLLLTLLVSAPALARQEFSMTEVLSVRVSLEDENFHDDGTQAEPDSLDGSPPPTAEEVETVWVVLAAVQKVDSAFELEASRDETMPLLVDALSTVKGLASMDIGQRVPLFLESVRAAISSYRKAFKESEDRKAALTEARKQLALAESYMRSFEEYGLELTEQSPKKKRSPLSDMEMGNEARIEALEPQNATKATPISEKSERRAQVEELLELYGMKERFEEYPIRLRVALAKLKEDSNPERYQAIKIIFRDVFQPEVLYAQIGDNIEAQANPEQLRNALEWLRSPLVRKIVPLEVESGTLEGEDRQEEYAERIKWDSPSEQRLVLVARFDKVTELSEAALEMEIGTLIVIFEAMAAGASPRVRVKIKEIVQKIDEMKPKMRIMAKDKIRAWLLYIYQTVSDEELGDYIIYWETENGRWLWQMTKEASLKVIIGALEEMARRAGRLF